VLLSVIVQSEHVATGKTVQKLYYPIMNTLSFCRPVLLSVNVQTEHVAAGESFQTTILSEHYHF